MDELSEIGFKHKVTEEVRDKVATREGGPANIG